MPLRNDIKKVMVIGSGPIIIGQAAEFDYAGTQACRALREEGLEVVLVNSNPATIMTDTKIADRVYVEPLTPQLLKNIIAKEKPDSLLPTLGGQTGLNLAMELAESGYLEEAGVKLLGTKVASIKKAEDRELFKKLMEEIGEPVIQSEVAETIEKCLEIADELGYPVIVRPAYTMGGTGGGIADNPDELRIISNDGLRASRVSQVLIERSIAGWKEIEYEVMRDSKGNVITVCNMENIDPVGIHTGDSVVVAPSQTLRDAEYQMLRTAALKIIDALEIEGGCNVQFALSTHSMDYRIIEVNPRVSRSSALASKATGYPIARVAGKIAVGYSLDELENRVTGKTVACFEPALDYVVVKIPKFPFDKFVKADKSLGTQMKATGEVMAIAGTIEEGLLKAVRSLEVNMDSFEVKWISDMNEDELMREMKAKTHERLYVVAEALRRGMDINEIAEITTMDLFFLNKIHNIVTTEEWLKKQSLDDLTYDDIKDLKMMGFADSAIARMTGVSVNEFRKARKKMGILPTYKVVDTCAAEFEAVSPYYYSTWMDENEAIPDDVKKIVVLGSGPIRIGQGIEFDYCSVHSIWALKRMGYQAIIVNNNPETVSTDFDTSDRLYFEPLTDEDVLNILDLEKPDGVIVQFGGQTAIKRIKAIAEAGYKIIGTQPKDVDAAENRKLFDALLERLNIPRPKGGTVFEAEEAIEIAQKLGYPVLVRPSYVLGGMGMEIAWSDADISEYMKIINMTKQEHPILIDKYIVGKEIEIDAICDGDDIIIPGIMEHIERAGVHSGDSISIYPAMSLSDDEISKLVEYTKALAKGLNVLGLMNIQYIVTRDEIYVIEVNPRASRTVPYLSKVTGVNMVDYATRAMLGEKVADMGVGTGLLPNVGTIAVKVPVFSFEKLPLVETSLGPEMKSTGEVLGVGYTVGEALYKGLLGAGFKLEKGGTALITVAKSDKQEVIPLAEDLYSMGYKIVATPGTANFLRRNQVPASNIHRINRTDIEPNIGSEMHKGNINLIINTPTKGRQPQRDGFMMRREAVERSIPCLTSLDTAKALIASIKLGLNEADIVPIPLNDIEALAKLKLAERQKTE